MKDLLTALRTQIAAELKYLHGKRAVHVLPDEDLLPTTTVFPCVGLKDGPVLNNYYINGNKRTLVVDIIGYVLLNSEEASLMGKGGQTGILDMTDDLKTALVQYDPEGYINYIGEDVLESSSETMENDGRLIQKKRITMSWRTT